MQPACPGGLPAAAASAGAAPGRCRGALARAQAQHPPRGLTCAQQGPAAPVPAGPAVGLGELVGRHLIEDASNAAVAFAPPPRGAGLGFPTCGGTQGVQRQGPAETGRTVSSALGWSEDLCPPPSKGPGGGTLNPTSEAGALLLGKALSASTKAALRVTGIRDASWTPPHGAPWLWDGHAVRSARASAHPPLLCPLHGAPGITTRKRQPHRPPTQGSYLGAEMESPQGQGLVKAWRSPGCRPRPTQGQTGQKSPTDPLAEADRGHNPQLRSHRSGPAAALGGCSLSCHRRGSGLQNDLALTFCVS